MEGRIVTNQQAQDLQGVFFDADTFFPTLDKQTWEESSNSVHKPDEKNIYTYSFKKYIRI